MGRIPQRGNEFQWGSFSSFKFADVGDSFFRSGRSPCSGTVADSGKEAEERGASRASGRVGRDPSREGGTLPSRGAGEMAEAKGKPVSGTQLDTFPLMVSQFHEADKMMLTVWAPGGQLYWPMTVGTFVPCSQKAQERDNPGKTGAWTMGCR